MLIAGCCAFGASEAGAFGFSNDRALVYCANTFNWGGGAASGGAPLPLVMEISPGAFSSERDRFCAEFAGPVPKMALSGRVAIIAPPHSTRTTIAPGRQAAPRTSG